ERPQGTLRIDQGAAHVLLEQGASLLPIGVRAVKGRFERGAVVRVVGEDDRVLGQGLVNYSRDELERLRGHHSPEITKILGYTYGDEAIHRDNLVLV
ncbi:MAG: glutamate 5-kinase, partial [Chloroflexi bacterium]|nr:glutamate 5-kinase [Chloroflexota bacterium]